MLLEASIVTRFSGFNLKSLILLFFTSILLSKLLLDKFKDVNLLLVKFRDSNFVLFHRLRLVKLWFWIETFSNLVLLFKFI